MKLSTLPGLKHLVLNFLNFLSSRTLLSYKPLSYIKNMEQWNLDFECEFNDLGKDRGDQVNNGT